MGLPVLRLTFNSPQLLTQIFLALGKQMQNSEGVKGIDKISSYNYSITYKLPLMRNKVKA